MAAMTLLTMAMIQIMISVKFNLSCLMKKIISTLMIIAAAAISFSSCQKQEMITPDASQEVTLTFSSEKPAFADETKTEWNGETIQWSAGDKISIAYTVDGDWMGFEKTEEDQTVVRSNPKLYKSDPLTEATEVAKFNVASSFNIADEGAHVFYGVYPAPSGTSFDDAPVASLSVPSIQTPNASSFDGAADLMTGVSVDAFNSIAEAKAENISMKWTRLVAHANITLKALKDVTAGETVSSIKLTAQEGANLVGSQKVNLLTNEVECNNNESNVIDLMGGNLSVSAEGNIEFWACFLPTTLTSLKVEVETNKASYTREITGIEKTFKQNARNTLSIKMNEATRVAKEEESWVLVTPADGLTEGTYVLVASTKNQTGALVSTNGSSSAPTFNTSVSVSDNTLNGVTEAMQFDLSGTAGNYKLAVTGQTTNYLYTTSTNNGVRVGTNANNVWTITQHESNADAFVFKCNATSRFLGVYNESDWRCYTAYDATNFTSDKGSSQIYLYKKQSGPVVPDTTPSITVEETLELTSAESEGTISVTYKNLEALEAAAYSDEACTTECDWLIALWENDAVSYLAEANEGDERTAYIQIYALDADANEFTKVITVTQEGKPTVDTTLDGDYWIYEPNAQKVMAPIGETETSARPGNGIATVTDGNVATFAVNNFKFAYDADMQAYTIKDSYGRYLYSGYYNGNVSAYMYASATLPEGSSGYWSATRNSDGTYVLLNKDTNYELAYDASYSNWSLYASGHNKAYPTLVKADNPLVVELSSISVSGYKTSFVEGESFEFGGDVTATYTDGSTKDVTDHVFVTEPTTMSDGAKVSVTYTEGTITKTFEYTISVKGAGAEVELVTETISGTFTYVSASKTLSLTTASGITVTQTIASGSTAIGQSYNTATTLRVYKGHALTFTGKTITKIELTHDSSRAGNSVTASSGTYTPGTTLSIWEGESNNIVITNTGETANVQLRPTKIVVTYQN